MLRLSTDWFVVVSFFIGLWRRGGEGGGGLEFPKLILDDRKTHDFNSTSVFSIDNVL